MGHYKITVVLLIEAPDPKDESDSSSADNAQDVVVRWMRSYTPPVIGAAASYLLGHKRSGNRGQYDLHTPGWAMRSLDYF